MYYFLATFGQSGTELQNHKLHTLLAYSVHTPQHCHGKRLRSSLFLLVVHFRSQTRKELFCSATKLRTQAEERLYEHTHPEVLPKLWGPWNQPRAHTLVPSASRTTHGNSRGFCSLLYAEGNATHHPSLHCHSSNNCLKVSELITEDKIHEFRLFQQCSA